MNKNNDGSPVFHITMRKLAKTDVIARKKHTTNLHTYICYLSYCFYFLALDPRFSGWVFFRDWSKCIWAQRVKGENSSIPNHFFLYKTGRLLVNNNKKVAFTLNNFFEFYTSNEILKKYKLIRSRYMFCTLQSKGYLEWKPIQFINSQLEKCYRYFVK